MVLLLCQLSDYADGANQNEKIKSKEKVNLRGQIRMMISFTFFMLTVSLF